MTKKDNIKVQIRDIDVKIKRLELQKTLLNDKLRRIEEHSKRNNGNLTRNSSALISEDFRQRD